MHTADCYGLHFTVYQKQRKKQTKTNLKQTNKQTKHNNNKTKQAEFFCSPEHFFNRGYSCLEYF